MHRPGHETCAQKNLAHFTSESRSLKIWFDIAHENHRMRGMLASGLVLPSKLVAQAVSANQIHRQGLDGCP